MRATWTQGGACCLAILSARPCSALPSPRALDALRRSSWAFQTVLSFSASFGLLFATPAEALLRLTAAAEGKKTPGSQIAHKSVNLQELQLQPWAQSQMSAPGAATSPASPAAALAASRRIRAETSPCAPPGGQRVPDGLRARPRTPPCVRVAGTRTQKHGRMLRCHSPPNAPKDQVAEPEAGNPIFFLDFGCFFRRVALLKNREPELLRVCPVNNPIMSF